MAAERTLVRLAFRVVMTCTLCWVFTLGAGGVILPPASAGASPLAIVLDLFDPEYGACGDVSVNGYVGTDSGAITRMSWDWGDGVVADSWFPASHHYAANGDYLVQVTAYASTGDTRTETVTAVVANAGDPSCSYTLRLHPPVLLLRDGHTTGALRLELRASDGKLVSLAGRPVTFTSSNPALAEVDADGTVTSAGFGEAQIEASVEGFPRSAIARVVAGRFRVEPAIQLLSPAGEPTGALELVAANADGTLVVLQAPPVTFQGNGSSAVATVDAQGIVTAEAPPLGFWDSPYFDASLPDGRPSNNASFTRVTEDPLGLTMRLYGGAHVAFWVADQVLTYPYGELMGDLQVVDVSDHAYGLEKWLAGATPFNGDTQFMVMDPGYDEDGTVPCGLSGNPLRLGVGVDNGRSCFGGEDWLQWGIMYHEMGHNFLIQQPFYDWLSGLADPGDYSEGMATMLGVYAIDSLLAQPPGWLSPTTIENLSRSGIPLTPAFVRSVLNDKLDVYEQDPDYADSFDADILDAIMTQLHDEFGMAFLYRFLSAFVAGDEWRDVQFDNEEQRLTFWVAACSAAADADLMARFRDEWGFPIDEDFYIQILPQAQRLVARRDPTTDAGQDHRIPVGEDTDFPDAAAFDWEGDPLTLAWQVESRPAGSSASPIPLSALHPSLQPDAMGRYVLGLKASDALINGPSDTVTITACILASPHVEISRSGDDVVLSWTNQYAAHEIFEHGSNPYLTPATGTVIGAGEDHFVHTNALAPPLHTHYYLVRATCGGEATSNRTGAFHFDLTRGQ